MELAKNGIGKVCLNLFAEKPSLYVKEDDLGKDKQVANSPDGPKVVIYDGRAPPASKAAPIEERQQQYKAPESVHTILYHMLKWAFSAILIKQREAASV